MPTALIVDDEPNVLYAFEKGLRKDINGVDVQSAETGTTALRKIESMQPDVVVLDVCLPDMTGLDVFTRIREIDPRIPVIFVTAHSTTDTAIHAMKLGAFDYLLKPVSIHQLCELVIKAIDLSRLRHVPALLEGDKEEGLSDRIIGRSRAMQDVYKMIGRVAEEDVAVLVLGESGTGKELIARALYHHSRRQKQPFLAINCAALPETLLESELFGHERGAFTGADRPRIGKFEQAHGGTLFLDELGDMSLATQAKVLRVLQDGCFERVGGSETIETNVRVIAATNQDLARKIERGEFRSDLLYRLNGFTIGLPPLRERPEDLPLLIEHLLRKSNRELSKQASRLSPETIRLLESYPWPGDVRELESVIQFAVVHAVGEVITPDCLPEGCRTSQGSSSDETIQEELIPLANYVRRLLRSKQPDLYRTLLTEVESVMIREALDLVGGNQVRASRRLGVSRTTLRAKMEGLGIDPIRDG